MPYAKYLFYKRSKWVKLNFIRGSNIIFHCVKLIIKLINIDECGGGGGRGREVHDLSWQSQGL